MNLLDFLVIFLIAAVGGPLLWGIGQWLFVRMGPRAEAGRKSAAAERYTAIQAMKDIDKLVSQRHITPEDWYQTLCQVREIVQAWKNM